MIQLINVYLRDIVFLLQISNNFGVNKKVIYVDGGIYVREWFVVIIVFYFIDQVNEVFFIFVF